MSEASTTETSEPYKLLYGDDIVNLVKQMEDISTSEGYRPITGSIMFSYGGPGKSASKLSFVIIMTRNTKDVQPNG